MAQSLIFLTRLDYSFDRKEKIAQATSFVLIRTSLLVMEYNTAYLPVENIVAVIVEYQSNQYERRLDYRNCKAYLYNH